MAEKAAAQTVNYLPETDPASIEANRLYQDALKRLNDSLDLRKNRTFDPKWLAAAQGFLAPTKSGNFFESLGNVASGLGQAQNTEIAEKQQEAQQRLGVASSGLELERLKQRDRVIGQYLGDKPGGLSAPAGQVPGGHLSGGLPGAPPSAAPSVPVQGAQPPAAGGLAPQAPQASGLPDQKPAGFESVQGVQTMPPNKDYLTGRQFISMSRYEKGKSFPDLLKEAQKMDQDRFVAKEGGVQDMSTGMFYQFPSGDQAERQIYGKTMKVDKKTAAMLDMYAANNDPRYHDIARRATQEPSRGAPGEAPAIRSEEERAAERKELEARSAKLGEKAAEKEANIKSLDQNARRIHGITGRVNNYMGESQNYFGIFQRPGLVSAIGNFVSQGIQTPGGTINLPALQQSITQLLPGVKQSDLDNIQKAAADLAEMELLFTRIYLSGQGQVTEGERRIVQRIPGGVANSPAVLKTRMELLRGRSQFDMDTAAAWDSWEKQNPGKSYLRFERSDLFKDIEKNYEERLAEMEKRLPSVPTQPGRPSAGSSAGPASGLDAARKRAAEALNQKP